MERTPRRIPEATVARLPVYLRSLLELAEDQTPTISSERLAEMAGVNAAKVRKDLSYLGSYGTRGVVRRQIKKSVLNGMEWGTVRYPARTLRADMMAAAVDR